MPFKSYWRHPRFSGMRDAFFPLFAGGCGRVKINSVYSPAALLTVISSPLQVDERFHDIKPQADPLFVDAAERSLL